MSQNDVSKWKELTIPLTRLRRSSRVTKKEEPASEENPTSEVAVFTPYYTIIHPVKSAKLDQSAADDAEYNRMSDARQRFMKIGLGTHPRCRAPENLIYKIGDVVVLNHAKNVKFVVSQVIPYKDRCYSVRHMGATDEQSTLISEEEIFEKKGQVCPQCLSMYM